MNQTKLAAILALDAVCDGYQVVMTPDEAVQCMAQFSSLGKAGSQVLGNLVRAINGMVPRMDFGADDPASGRAGHVFHIGRSRGRLIAVDLFKGYLPSTFDRQAFLERIKDEANRAECASIALEDDETNAIIRMIWD